MPKPLIFTEHDVRLALAPIDKPGVKVFGIPKGGLCAASYLQHAKIVHRVTEADVILDDIWETGATIRKYSQQNPDAGTHVLVHRERLPAEQKNLWVEFPWEANELGMSEPELAVRSLLRFIGENPDRDGLKGTPDRVVRYFAEMTTGYKADPMAMLERNFATEDDGVLQYDNMVVVRDIEFFSMCEHHLVTIDGICHVAYIPKTKVVGLSKIARVVDVFAKRLTLQERMTAQIAEVLMKGLGVLDVAVVIDAAHYCMVSRGVQKRKSRTRTAALHGSFLDNPVVREELMFHLR